MNTYAIITTIQAPTKSVEILQSYLAKFSILLVVVGDRKGPFDYPNWSQFLPIDAQYKLPFKLAHLLPEKHYARKNLGYLHAFKQGAACLYETDDDNAPEPNWSLKTETKIQARMLSGKRWLNVYKHYTSINIWPRGLALDYINEAGILVGECQVFAPIRQSLANGSPDVDAIWRLALDSDVTFKKRGVLALSKNVWCPFNSQNTWWSKEAFPLMYLPSFVSFRMTDIWRSFVAQRCLWAMGANLVFDDADVFQERNPHNLMRDFLDEVSGYLNNDNIVDALGRLELSPGVDQVIANLVSCYNTLVSIGVVPDKELPLVAAWVEDCKRLQDESP